MASPSISHTFFDFEIEPAPLESGQEEIHLVKILAIDGRRFTYEVHGALTEEAIRYIKTLIDAAVFSDTVIESTDEGFEAREATTRLRKHS
jgi:hypothetical protein